MLSCKLVYWCCASTRVLLRRCVCMGVHLAEWWVMAVCMFLLFARPMEWPHVQAAVQLITPWSSTACVAPFTLAPLASTFSHARYPCSLVGTSSALCLGHAQACGTGAGLRGRDTCGTDVCVCVLESRDRQLPRASTMGRSVQLATSDHTTPSGHLKSLHTFVRYRGSVYSYYRPGRWVLGVVRGTVITQHARVCHATGVLPARWYQHIRSGARPHTHYGMALLVEASTVLSSMLLGAITTCLTACSAAVARLSRNKVLVQVVTLSWVFGRALCKETSPTFSAPVTASYPFTFIARAFQLGGSDSCTLPLALPGRCYGGAVLMWTLASCTCMVVVVLAVTVTHRGSYKSCSVSCASGAPATSKVTRTQHNTPSNGYATHVPSPSDGTGWSTGGKYAPPSADLTACGDVESNPGPTGNSSYPPYFTFRVVAANDMNYLARLPLMTYT
jgi:hypothetical protein